MTDAISPFPLALPLTHSVSLSLCYPALFPLSLFDIKMLSDDFELSMNKQIPLRTVLISKVTSTRNSLLYVGTKRSRGSMFEKILAVIFTSLCFLCNLQLGLLSQSVCPLQASTALCMVTLQHLGPIHELQRKRSVEKTVIATDLLRIWS